MSSPVIGVVVYVKLGGQDFGKYSHLRRRVLPSSHFSLWAPRHPQTMTPSMAVIGDKIEGAAQICLFAQIDDEPYP